MALIRQQHRQRVQHRNRCRMLVQQLAAQLFSLGGISRLPKPLDARKRELKIRRARRKRDHGPTIPKLTRRDIAGARWRNLPSARTELKAGSAPRYRFWGR